MYHKMSAPAPVEPLLELRVEPGDHKDFLNHTRDPHDHCKYLQEGFDACGLPVIVTIGPLTAGDYGVLVYKKEIPPLERVLLALIERKGMADMLASLNDGRYEDQRRRMVDSTVERLYWLLVGRKPEDAADCERIDSAHRHLDTMRGMHVVELADHRAASRNWFCKTLRYFIQDNLHTGVKLGEAMTLAAKSKLNTQEKCWLAQLAAVRGISATKASAIAKVFPSAATLLMAYARAVSEYEPTAPAKGRGKKRTLDDQLDELLHHRVVVAGKKKEGFLGPADSKTIRRTFLAESDIPLLQTFRVPSQ